MAQSNQIESAVVCRCYWYSIFNVVVANIVFDCVVFVFVFVVVVADIAAVEISKISHRNKMCILKQRPHEAYILIYISALNDDT